MGASNAGRGAKGCEEEQGGWGGGKAGGK